MRAILGWVTKDGAARVAVLLVLLARSAAAGVECSKVADQAVTRSEQLSGSARAEELEKARAALERVVRRDSPWECHQFLAGVLVWRASAGGVTPAAQRSMRERAISEIELALKGSPKDIITLRLRAQTEEDLGLFESAASTHYLVTLLEQQHPYAHKERMRLLLKAGKPEAALSAGLEWTRVKPDDAEAHYFLAERWEAAGEVEEAKAEYRRALELDSDAAAASFKLAVLLAGEGRWKEAETVFAATRGYDVELGWYGRGVSRLKQGDVDEARHWLEMLETKGEKTLVRLLRALIEAPDSTPVFDLQRLAEK